LGVDLEKLVLIRPDNAEQVVDMVEGVLHAEDASIVVIDSLAALVTTHELDKSAEDAIVGRTGIVVNKLYRKVTQALGRARRDGREPTLVVINQIRFKIGVTHGNPETLPGGPSFAFGSSMTLRFYGKNIMETAVSTSLPAYKEVSVIVKKHKVPILANKAVMQIALQPIKEYGLKIGEAYDWNTLKAYLKAMELFSNEDKTWKLIMPDTGEVLEFKKQDDLKVKIYGDPDFGQRLRSSLITTMMDSPEVIE
jgi:RecA/RadA recombinase